MTLVRSTIETWLETHLAALTAKDIAALTTGISHSVTVIWPKTQWQTFAELQTKLEMHLAGWQTTRLLIKQLLIDVDQSVAAVEWIARVVNLSGQCYQYLGGTALDFDKKGRLTCCAMHLDLDRSSSVSDIMAEWPAQSWQPAPDTVSPPTRSAHQQVILANAHSWSSHQIETFQALYHEDIQLMPPWTHVVGKPAVEAIGQHHFETYKDTQVTVNRVIYDATQPHLGVCQQTFACTNLETGQRGQDADLAFFEICQGKLRYWRNYFDTQASIQDSYKTLDIGSLEAS